MCGIAGAFGFGRTVDSSHVSDMLETMASRGPDARRIETLEDGVLGANRLAIVDIEGGTNPVQEDSGR